MQYRPYSQNHDQPERWRHSVHFETVPISCCIGICHYHQQITGETFSTIGIHLSSPVFAHGQLYVAFSQATTRAGVKVNRFSISLGKLL